MLNMEYHIVALAKWIGGFVGGGPPKLAITVTVASPPPPACVSPNATVQRSKFKLDEIQSVGYELCISFIYKAIYCPVLKREGL